MRILPYILLVQVQSPLCRSVQTATLSSESSVFQIKYMELDTSFTVVLVPTRSSRVWWLVNCNFFYLALLHLCLLHLDALVSFCCITLYHILERGFKRYHNTMWRNNRSCDSPPPPGLLCNPFSSNGVGTSQHEFHTGVCSNPAPYS